jgi:hypothetical protein
MARKASVPVDKGQPGQYYFNEPQVIEIRSKKPVNASSYLDPRERPITSPPQSTYGDGACRLPTSHTINNYSPPKDCEYLLSRWPKRDDVDAYISMMEVQGFGQGSIVCRKHQPIQDHPKVYKWGVILMVHSYTAAAEYKPYLIKWFGDGQVESGWAEDLFLIHARLDNGTFWSILEAQDCAEFEEKTVATPLPGVVT